MITVLGFIAAGFMILQSFNDWGESPLLTTIQSIDTPITDLLFPSVTVCQGLYLYFYTLFVPQKI
jgi:hypothetical protein